MVVEPNELTEPPENKRKETKQDKLKKELLY